MTKGQNDTVFVILIPVMMVSSYTVEVYPFYIHVVSPGSPLLYFMSLREPTLPRSA